jgi:hypothetical protein
MTWVAQRLVAMAALAASRRASGSTPTDSW